MILKFTTLLSVIQIFEAVPFKPFFEIFYVMTISLVMP